jgi:hypothetical protein
MKKPHWKCVALASVIVATVIWLSAASSQPPLAARKTVFSTLKVGQPVILKDKAALFEISTMDIGDVGTHKVIEIGEDYVALRDIADITELRVPIYAVRAIVQVQTRPK